MANFEFIKQGNFIYREYIQASIPSFQDEQKSGRLGQIFKIIKMHASNSPTLSDTFNDSQSGHLQMQNVPLLSRMIELDRIKSYKIQEILQEANLLYSFTTRTNCLAPIRGVYFDENQHNLHVYMPKLESLHCILHSKRHTRLKSIEKLLIAKKLAKSMF